MASLCFFIYFSWRDAWQEENAAAVDNQAGYRQCGEAASAYLSVSQEIQSGSVSLPNTCTSRGLMWTTCSPQNNNSKKTTAGEQFCICLHKPEVLKMDIFTSASFCRCCCFSLKDFWRNSSGGVFFVCVNKSTSDMRKGS